MSYLFQEEFNGAANSQPGTTNWNIEVGNPGNPGDVAQYSSSATYVYEDGHSNLIIAMGPVNTGGAGAGRYPSGWIDTYGKFALMANQSMEFSLTITPAGGAQGVWPAVWFQGTNNVVSGGPFGVDTYPSPWAELDAVESYGGVSSQPFSPTTNFGDCTFYSTIEDTGTSSPYPITLTAGPDFISESPSVYCLPAPLSTGSNIFRIDCIGSGTTVTEIQMYVNGQLCWSETATAANTERAGAWGYNTTASGGLFIIISGQAVTSYPPVLSSITPVMQLGYVRAWAPAGPDPNTGNAMIESAGAAFTTSSGTDTVTTGSYTPTAGTLQVALIGCGNGDGESFASATLTDTSGSGSWTLLESATANGVGMGWVYARAAWSGAATVTFTVTSTSGTVGDLCIVTRQFANAAPIGSQPGVTATVSSTTAIQNLSITPATTGSQVVGGCGTSAGAVVLIANASTVIYGQTDAGSFGDVEACIQANAASVSGTPISLGFTNTAVADWGFALAEIVPAAVTAATGNFFQVF